MLCSYRVPHNSLNFQVEIQLQIKTKSKIFGETSGKNKALSNGEGRVYKTSFQPQAVSLTPAIHKPNCSRVASLRSTVATI